MAKDEFKKHLYALIICGGGGTRLWPRSRNKTPKQFSRLLAKETLFQKTVSRLKGLVQSKNIFAVTTSQAYAREIEKEASIISHANIVWEPMRRNTAIACGLGTLMAKKQDPQAVVMNFWADHLVENESVFKKVELVAAQAAFEAQTLVAVGIKPTRIHTGLGHIQAKKIVRKINSVPVYKLEKFVEKPDYQTAQKFMATDEYFWNSGMYVWSAQFFLDALRKYSPTTFKALAKIEKVLGTRQLQEVMKLAYEKAPDISVDVAVSEKLRNALMIPAQMGWNDIGDWSVVYDISPKDKNGNVVIKFGKKGEFIGLNAKNNLIQFDNQLIAAIGVEDLIIVDTTEAILICKKDKAQDVKELVNFLKEKNKLEYL